MSSRRSFMKKAAGLVGAAALSPALTAAENLNNGLHEFNRTSFTSDEDFWSYIRECFTESPNILNLNNAGVSPQPKQVQDAHIRYYQMSNEVPTLYMWRVLEAGREPLRKRLAQLAGASSEEIAINRNSTEGLNTIIFGLDLKPGDEVVLGRYDYPNMMNAWKQREQRDGIKLAWVEIPQPDEENKDIVSLYEKAITPKTKIVHITHMINWSGQIVPAREIADMAHKKGCEVIVDAAHSFAQMDFKLTDTGADYAAVSLHKWLHAPFGNGMMYIKKDKIKKVWPLLSNDHPDSEDIKKFETLGTRSNASEMAIGAAIDFYNMIGAKRKENRLRFLKNYWAEQAVKIPKVKMNTSLKPEFSCALAHFSMEGWTGAEMDAFFYEKYKIHVVGVIHEKINGIRVSPSVYTSTKDLDYLLDAIEAMSKSNPLKK